MNFSKEEKDTKTKNKEDFEDNEDFVFDFKKREKYLLDLIEEKVSDLVSFEKEKSILLKEKTNLIYDYGEDWYISKCISLIERAVSINNSIKMIFKEIINEISRLDESINEVFEENEE